VVYTLLRNYANLNHYDAFHKNAIRYARKGSEVYKVLDGCTGSKTSRVFRYVPKEEEALVTALTIGNSRSTSLNPRMGDPKYRAQITNLFLATKFKQQQS